MPRETGERLARWANRDGTLGGPISGRLLTAIDKQRAYIHRIALRKLACPVCHTLADLYEASDDLYDVVQDDIGDEDFHCINPECGVRLKYFVGLIGGETDFRTIVKDGKPEKHVP